MNFENAPQELKELKQWVCWQLVTRQGKQTKLPINARTGRLASSTDQDTWSTFDDCVKASKNFNGIGFVFSENDPYFGVDLDGHVDNELVQWFATYTERSQSGTGCHIIGRGKLNRKGTKISTGEHEGVEVYDRGRYFVVTGDIIHPAPISECQEKLDEFVKAVLPAEKDVDLSRFIPLAGAQSIKSDILDQIRDSAQGQKFDMLWTGNWRSMYGSQSEADAALLSILRFWTGGDRAESIRLFRASGLMRKKAERDDYMARTWAKIDHGEVKEQSYVETAPPAPRIMREQSTAPWRKVTIDHVRKAIAGTILEPMCEAICSPTDPPIPLEVGILKALSLCGCALSGRKEGVTKLGDYVCRGSDLAKVRIMTSGGQVPNFYCLLVGRSASGKDIGNIASKAAMQRKMLIGNAGSEEGLMDAYVAKPTGLLNISEMVNFLDARHWQSKAASFLTNAFNSGYFDISLSKRSDAPKRESNFCFPNIMASVQPGVLAEHTTRTAIDSGFLGRFIVAQMPGDFYPYPRNIDLIPAIMRVVGLLDVLMRKEGDIFIAEKYSQPLAEMFQKHKAEPAPSWSRLSGEYYPRFALLLSMPAKDNGSNAAIITPDGMERAAVLVQYFFGQAEQVFAGICHDPAQARFEDLCRRIYNFVESRGGECPRYDIGHNCGRNSKAKDRNEAMNELQSRGLIEIEPTIKGGAKIKISGKL